MAAAAAARRSSYLTKSSDTYSEPLARRRVSSSAERGGGGGGGSGGGVSSDPQSLPATAAITLNGVQYGAAGTTTSGTETEEELSNSRKCLIRKKLLTLPAFRLGPQYGTVTCAAVSPVPAGPFSTASTEEQLSSFSEQAWDSYQVGVILPPRPSRPQKPKMGF